MKEPRMIAKTTRSQTVVAADLLRQWRRRKRWERASAGRGAPVIRLQGTNIGEKEVAFKAAQPDLTSHGKLSPRTDDTNSSRAARRIDWARRDFF
jgi:hypothetical protein